MKRSASFSPRKSRFVGGILSAIVVMFVAITACSNQGEGERCEVKNNNDDCDTSAGLICYPQGQLKGSSSDRCCPEDRSKATHPVCKTAVDVGVDGSTPADTGPPPNPVSDGGRDADAATSNDADAADATSDADADAN